MENNLQETKAPVPGSISVIIPLYNERSTIKTLLNTIEPLRRDGAEIIFCDGGSKDGTLMEIPEDRGYRILESPRKGRAAQMNYGADKSSGEILFFLHCDSELPEDAAYEIRQVMENYKAGCFGIAFHSKNFFMWTCRVISNHRVKDRKIMFGDQGIFLKRELFYRAGKFPELPIMEDYSFSLKLKEMKIKLGMARKRIYTSDRRFRGGSIRKLKIMWAMNRLRAAYRKGCPIEDIAKRYKDIR